LFKCLFSNISSLSPHAKEYIVNIPKDIQLLALVEIHKKDPLSVESFFAGNGYSISYNPPEESNVLSHGGELVAVRKHLNSRPVAKEYLESVADYFMATLRFAARILVFKGLEVLVVAIYSWVSEILISFFRSLPNPNGLIFLGWSLLTLKWLQPLLPPPAGLLILP
jgi:hypothetical protein